MDAILKLLGASWRTTVVGVLASVFGYLGLMGPELPTDFSGWMTAVFTGLVAYLGISAKSVNVSNAEHPRVAAIVTETPAAAAKAVPTRTITK